MEVNPRLAKRPLETNGRLANLELTSLVKEATVDFLKLYADRLYPDADIIRTNNGVHQASEKC